MSAVLILRVLIPEMLLLPKILVSKMLVLKILVQMVLVLVIFVAQPTNLANLCMISMIASRVNIEYACKLLLAFASYSTEGTIVCFYSANLFRGLFIILLCSNSF